MYDAIIIGAGVVGCAVAQQMAKYNGKLLVVDRMEDVADGASKANSGIVHAGFDAHPGTEKARLNVKGSMMYGDLAKELGVPYTQPGALVLGFSEEDRATLNNLLAQAQANNVPVKLQAFLRFRPSLLSDFDAKRSRNPTPRSWSSVALIPESIEKKAKLFREHVAGSVGDGAAAEYVGFLRVMKRLPSAERIINDPEGIEIPSANDIQWSTIAQLSSVLTTPRQSGPTRRA